MNDPVWFIGSVLSRSSVCHPPLQSGLSHGTVKRIPPVWDHKRASCVWFPGLLHHDCVAKNGGKAGESDGRREQTLQMRPGKAGICSQEMRNFLSRSCFNNWILTLCCVFVKAPVPPQDYRSDRENDQFVTLSNRLAAHTQTSACTCTGTQLKSS